MSVGAVSFQPGGGDNTQKSKNKTRQSPLTQRNWSVGRETKANPQRKSIESIGNENFQKKTSFESEKRKIVDTQIKLFSKSNPVIKTIIMVVSDSETLKNAVRNTQETFNYRMDKIFEKFKIEKKDLESFKTEAIHGAKLFAVASLRLGWPLYHLYLKHSAFPGRMEAFCMNIGNLREISKDLDIEEAKKLADLAKFNGLKMKNDAPLKGSSVKGVCFGTVVDLFENFHAQSEKNTPSSEALKMHARYEKGVSSKAAANQIVYEALSLEYRTSTVDPVAKQLYNKKYKDLEQNEKVMIQQHMKQQAIFDLLELKMEHALFAKNNQENLSEILTNLSPGTYFIALPDHAIAYVKHPDGMGHVFGPNKGLIRCDTSPDDHAIQLQKVINSYPPQAKTTKEFLNTLRDKTEFIVEINRVEPHQMASEYAAAA